MFANGVGHVTARSYSPEDEGAFFGFSPFECGIYILERRKLQGHDIIAETG
jgi:hypothetical protein